MFSLIRENGLFGVCCDLPVLVIGRLAELEQVASGQNWKTVLIVPISV